MDDILIYSGRRGEHLQHIRSMLETLDKKKLHNNLNICMFLSMNWFI
jgi:hypothetical protein